jgi:hypothetical protein
VFWCLAAAGTIDAVQVDPRRDQLDRRQLHMLIGARKYLVGSFAPQVPRV